MSASAKLHGAGFALAFASLIVAFGWLAAFAAKCLFDDARSGAPLPR
ncbi:MAG: hypothetical protein KGM42_09385 [Hyphomicrobiales bacterium]|nr:hypothetical protein [Hyphomicrobiales bacterium]